MHCKELIKKLYIFYKEYVKTRLEQNTEYIMPEHKFMYLSLYSEGQMNLYKEMKRNGELNDLFL